MTRTKEQKENSTRTNKKKDEQEEDEAQSQYNQISYRQDFKEYIWIFKYEYLDYQKDDVLRRIDELVHRMDQHTVCQEQRMEQEQEDKRQEEEEDVSFATSSLLTCFEEVEKELDEAILSLNETEISFSNKIKENKNKKTTTSK